MVRCRSKVTLCTSFFFQNITLEGLGKTVTGLHVVFSDVTLFTTGLYGCEASADPSFHTQLVRKHLTVLGIVSKVL